MTVGILRQLKDLSFSEAVTELESAHAQTPSHDLIIYRETLEKDADGVPVCDVHRYDDLGDAIWTTDDVLGTNWIFEDRGSDEALIPAPDVPEGPETRTFTREDIVGTVNFVIGRFYYANPDAHKLGPEIAKRLGFAE